MLLGGNPRSAHTDVRNDRTGLDLTTPPSDLLLVGTLPSSRLSGTWLLDAEEVAFEKSAAADEGSLKW